MGREHVEAVGNWGLEGVSMSASEDKGDGNLTR